MWDGRLLAVLGGVCTPEPAPCRGQGSWFPRRREGGSGLWGCVYERAADLGDPDLHPQLSAGVIDGSLIRLFQMFSFGPVKWAGSVLWINCAVNHKDKTWGCYWQIENVWLQGQRPTIKLRTSTFKKEWCFSGLNPCNGSLSTLLLS